MIDGTPPQKKKVNFHLGPWRRSYPQPCSRSLALPHAAVLLFVDHEACDLILVSPLLWGLGRRHCDPLSKSSCWNVNIHPYKLGIIGNSNGPMMAQTQINMLKKPHSGFPSHYHYSVYPSNHSKPAAATHGWGPTH